MFYVCRRGFLFVKDNCEVVLSNKIIVSCQGYFYASWTDFDQVPDVSAPNDEGITALHNAICAGHYEIMKFLVEFGCDVNSPDTDGW